jgi:hypothetical protein
LYLFVLKAHKYIYVVVAEAFSFDYLVFKLYKNYLNRDYTKTKEAISIYGTAWTFGKKTVQCNESKDS